MKKIFIFIFTIVILVGCSNGEDTFEEKIIRQMQMI